MRRGTKNREWKNQEKNGEEEAAGSDHAIILFQEREKAAAF